MSELKATPGPWRACVLVGDDGVKMTPEQIGGYVTEAVKAGSSTWFSFVLGAKPDGEYDICHVGNGEDSPHNAHLIAAAPELYGALDELADLMQGVIEGDYKPNSFTLQIARAALAKARGEQQ